MQYQNTYNIYNIKTLTYTISKHLYTISKHFFPFFTIKTKNEQANKSVPEKFEPKKS